MGLIHPQRALRREGDIVVGEVNWFVPGADRECRELISGEVRVDDRADVPTAGVVQVDTP